MVSILWRSLISAATCVLLTAAEARAGRGFVVVTWGETIAYVGDPSGPAGPAWGDGRALKVGYKYEYAGMFWVDLWTWGGTYCV
jgi:hypothetical protein